MKTLVVLIAIFLSSTSAFNATRVDTLNIPLFILDTENPWIVKHKGLLNSHADIETALCTTNLLHPAYLSLLRKLKSHSIPAPPSPSSLFRAITIKNQSDRPGYKNAIDRLNEILSCPAALENLYGFKFDPYFHEVEESTHAGPLSAYLQDLGVGPENDMTSTKNYTWFEKLANQDSETNLFDLRKAMDKRENFWDIPEPPFELSELLAQLLSGQSTSNLTFLAWNVPCLKASFFERDFDKLNLTMLTIKHLDLGRYQEYMLRFTGPRFDSLAYFESWDATCPWSDSYWITGRKPGSDWTLEYALWRTSRERMLSMVQGLEIGHMVQGYWDYGEYTWVGVLMDILDTFPNLNTLYLAGHIGDERWAANPYKPGLERHLRTHLTTLASYQEHPNTCQSRKMFHQPYGYNPYGYSGAWSEHSDTPEPGQYNEQYRYILLRPRQEPEDERIYPTGKLKKLYLPPADELDLGYSGGPSTLCGGADKVGGLACQRYMAQRNRDLRTALESALTETVKILPWLEEIAFGRARPMINRTEGRDLRTGGAKWS